MVQQLVQINNKEISNVRTAGLLCGKPNVKETNEGRVSMPWRHLDYFCFIILINRDKEMGEIALAIFILTLLKVVNLVYICSVIL